MISTSVCGSPWVIITEYSKQVVAQEYSFFKQTQLRFDSNSIRETLTTRIYLLKREETRLSQYILILRVWVLLQFYLWHFSLTLVALIYIWVFLYRFGHRSLKKFKISTFFDHADFWFTVSRHDKNLKSKIFLICGKSSMFYKQEKTTTFESL